MLGYFTKQMHHRYFLRGKQKKFLEDLTALITQGVPIKNAVDTLCKLSEGIVERVAIHIAYCIAQGKQLADGMQGWFARPLVEAVRASETSDNVLQTLVVVADRMSQRMTTLKRFIELLIYPSLFFIAALLAVVIVRHTFFEDLAARHSFSEWSALGKNIYHVGFLIEHWWWLTIAALIFMVLVVYRLLQQLTGRVRLFVDELPLVSLYRDMAAAYFMESLGLLVKNGVALKKALSIMHREASPYLSWHILKMEFALSGGAKDVGAVFQTQLIHDQDIIRLQTITKHKGFEEGLLSLGQRARQRVTRSVMMLGRVLSVLLIILSMVIIGTLSAYFIGRSIVN